MPRRVYTSLAVVHGRSSLGKDARIGDTIKTVSLFRF